MDVKVKYSFWLPKLLWRNAIVLYPFILISKSETESKKTNILNHEFIHILQIRKDGFFKFYSKYLLECSQNMELFALGFRLIYRGKKLSN